MEGPEDMGEGEGLAESGLEFLRNEEKKEDALEFTGEDGPELGAGCGRGRGMGGLLLGPGLTVFLTTKVGVCC